ncbi:MAG: FKBP-type peptidyl-prolyl cis-trans isomerase [Gemmataceae bacterium]
MKRFLAASVAALLVSSAAVTVSAYDNPPKVEKATEAPLGKVPPLDAKDWKKQKSGLEIWDAKEGNGEAVASGATVTVHYIGWLTNGKEFDASKKGGVGEPITFGLDQVIKGWQEGIPGMKPGGVRRLKIPAELAYGKRGAGDVIPPNSVLIFEVELVK